MSPSTCWPFVLFEGGDGTKQQQLRTRLGWLWRDSLVILTRLSHCGLSSKQAVLIYDAAVMVKPGKSALRFGDCDKICVIGDGSNDSKVRLDG